MVFALRGYLSKKDLRKDLEIDKAYELTEGKISYRDTNMQVTAIRLLVEMKLKQKIIVRMLQRIFPNTNVEELLQDTYCINPELAIKKNGKGHTISETVNILISELGYEFTQDNIEKLLNRINELDVDDLLDIYQNGTKSEKTLQLLIKTRNNNERIDTYKDVNKEVRYFVEAIIEGYDWRKIGRGLTKMKKEGN